MSPSRIMNAGLVFVLVVLALVILAVALVVFQGRQTPQGRPDYVALGSSFAAGADLGRLQPDSPLLCARSVNGYPEHLARMRGLWIIDMSCGGAVTKYLLRGGQFFQGPQLRVIDSRTRLVTITVGGNDIGYIGDLSLLAARRTNTLFGLLVRALWKGPKTPAQRDYAKLQSDLSATLRAIHDRAPKATVVLATYPTILPPSGTCGRLGLSEAEVDLMRQVADQLAETTLAAAAQGGALIVDMHRLGVAHNACAASPWTRGWSNAGAAPFHPTLQGAVATAEAISAAIKSL